MFYGAKKETFQFAAFLRKNLTPSERTLWEVLKNNHLNFRFKCQHPVNKYVVDFYCHAKLMVIEVDGSIHLLDEIHERDVEREKYIREFGIDFIRFTNEEVLFNLQGVQEKIIQFMMKRDKEIPAIHDLNFKFDM